MPRDEHDPIADTGMFRAFVERGDSERAGRRPVGAPTLILVLAGLVAAVVLVWLLLLR